MTDKDYWLFGVLLGLALSAVLVFVGSVVLVWLRAALAGAPIPLAALVKLRLQGLPWAKIAGGAIALHKAGVRMGFGEVVDLYEAGPGTFEDEVARRVRERRLK